MDTSISNTSPSDTPPKSSEPPFATVWDYARHRLRVGLRKPAVRLETGVTLLLLLLLAAPSLLTWSHRWLLTASPQAGALLVAPLTLAWLWLNRLRLAVPELDAVRQKVNANELTPQESFPEDDNETLVIRLLNEGHQEPVTRPFWPLLIGCLFYAAAFWIREPALTCLGFILVLVGVVGYRWGASVLRVSVFPFLFLLLMIPIPGILLDVTNDHLQSLLFGGVAHVLLNANVPTELAAEGNPLRVNVRQAQPYELYAAQAGTGIPEVLAVVILTIWFLSLVRAPFRTKLFSVVAGLLIMCVLMVLRLLILCWLSMVDRETTAILEPLTRVLLPILGCGVQLLLLRGLKCRKFQRWVFI